MLYCNFSFVYNILVRIGYYVWGEGGEGGGVLGVGTRDTRIRIRIYKVCVGYMHKFPFKCIRATVKMTHYTI